MIRLTKEAALKIQDRQIEHYAAIYGPEVRGLVEAATTADKLGEGEYDIVIINRHIPRGGAIEALIPAKVAAEEAIAARRAAL